MKNLFSGILIILFQFIFSSGLIAQSPVAWTKLKSTTAQGNVLSKFGNGTGYGSSEQVLFGKTETNNHEGYLTYQISDLGGMRKIGFAVIDSDEPLLNSIDYYFDIQKQGVLTMRTKTQTLNGTYAINDVLKIAREGDKIRFYKNDQPLFEDKINIQEDLIVRSELKNNNLTLSNVFISFSTNRKEYTPTINYSTRTLDLLSSSNDPEQFVWEDGETNNSSAKFLNGHYPVKITDANGNMSFREYSIGSLVVWDDFNNTIVSDNILSKNTSYQNNSWVSAKSSDLLQSTDNVWLEYIIEPQVDQKIIGFTKTTTSVNNFTQIEAGFLISKDNQLQLIHEGKIVKSIEYANKDRLLVEQKGGLLSWKLNGNEIHYSTSTISTGYFIAALIRMNATLKNVQYGKNDYNPVSTSWDEETDRGSISIDVTSISGIEGPFRYLLSENGMPSLLDIFPEINNQFYSGQLNQTEFLQGNDPSLTKTFTNIEMGTYYVTVFDNNGKRVFQKHLSVHPEFVFEQQTGLVTQDNKIRSTNENAAGSLQLYTLDGENSELRFKITDTKRDQYFGLIEVSETVTDYTSLDYGFRLEKTKLYTVVNGVKSNDYTVIKNGVDLSVIIKEHQLYLKLDNNPLFEGTLPIDVQLKGAVGGNIEKAISLAPIRLIKKSYNVITKVSQGTCDNAFGTFKFFVKKLGNPTPGYNFNYEISDGTTVITSGTGITNYTSIIYPFAPGTYTLTVTFTSGINNVYTETFTIGIQTEWTDLNMYSLTPNTYSLERTTDSPGSFSFGSAQNVLVAGQSGWIQMNPVLLNANGSQNTIRLSTLNPNSLVPVAGEEASITIIRVLNTNFLLWSGSAVSTFPANAVLRLNIDASTTPSTIDIYLNSTLAGTFNMPNDLVMIRAHSTIPGEGFDNVITSFDCSPDQTENTIDYAELKRKNDGGFALVIEGKLKFSFDEEYNLEQFYLPFKIYDKQHQVIASCDLDGNFTGIGAAVDYLKDDGRYDIDLSSVATIGEYYTLEVTTTKGDKRYLKFLRKN